MATLTEHINTAAIREIDNAIHNQKSSFDYRKTLCDINKTIDESLKTHSDKNSGIIDHTHNVKDYVKVVLKDFSHSLSDYSSKVIGKTKSALTNCYGSIVNYGKIAYTKASEKAKKIVSFFTERKQLAEQKSFEWSQYCFRMKVVRAPKDVYELLKETGAVPDRLNRYPSLWY